MSKDQNNKQQRDHQQGHSALARLIQLGREKSIITSEDILQFFPNPENDIEALDRIYAALIAADIPYRDK